MSERTGKELQIRNDEQILNSLGNLASSLTNYGLFPMGGYGTQLSQADTMWINNRWYLISNMRQMISEMYVEHGIVQTLVDQPVDDAFRSGVVLKSGQLDPEDLEKLMDFCERRGVFRSIIQAAKWARLYGGGAILIITDQDPRTPLNLKAINEKTPIEFRPVDMWELYHNRLNREGDIDPQDEEFLDSDQPFDYYGHKIHPSRVYRFFGKEPPSFIRPRLRGWGMSVLEKVVRTFNQYLKNQNVIFELMDEAKIDVYRMKGFNEALLTAGGTQRVSNRIQHANMIKNYNSALTMDINDEYEQKEMTFTGLAEMLVQIRQGLAADLKMPITKLFGISAAGFNAGEDDIENYNAMIEGEIRGPIKYQVIDIVTIACQKVFGFMPDDLKLEWPSLRILPADQEEVVKNHEFNRIMASYNSGLAEGKEAKQAINLGGLLPIELDESTDALPPVEGDYLVGGGDEVENSKDEKEKTIVHVYDGKGRKVATRVE